MGLLQQRHPILLVLRPGESPTHASPFGYSHVQYGAGAAGKSKPENVKPFPGIVRAEIHRNFQESLTISEIFLLKLIEIFGFLKIVNRHIY